jgi:hypothetical protein
VLPSSVAITGRTSLLRPAPYYRVSGDGNDECQLERAVVGERVHLEGSWNELPMNLLTIGFMNGRLFRLSEQFEADIIRVGLKGSCVNGVGVDTLQPIPADNEQPGS